MVEHNHDSTTPSPPLTAPLAQRETAASEENHLSQGFDVVALTASADGLKALSCILSTLPTDFPAAIVVVQHLSPRYPSLIAQILNRCTPLLVKEAEEGFQLSPGKVFIAPPDYHLLVNPDGSLSLSQTEKVHFVRPAAVNSTRWTLFNRLKETGLLVSTGSGRLTKFNRTRLKLPKTHFFDAACVGVTNELIVLASQPLNIKATGHGRRQMCRTNKFGFASRYVPRFKFVNSFQTGDIVKAVVSKGKKIGTYVGRVAVRSTGSFKISGKNRLIQGIGYQYCQVVYKKDGYNYVY